MSLGLYLRMLYARPREVPDDDGRLGLAACHSSVSTRFQLCLLGLS